MGKKIFLALLVMVALALPAHAAGFPDTYGYGVRAVGLAGAFTAVADNFAAAYYNPAGLAQNRGNHFNLEYLYTSPDIEAKFLDGSPLVTTTADGTVRNDPTDYAGGSDMSLQIPVIGMELDVNGLADVKPNIQAGVAMSLTENLDTLYRIHNYPPDQPNFFRYGDNISRFHINVGVGAEVVPELIYLGGGVQMMMYGDGKFYVDNLVAGTDEADKNVIGQAKMSAPMESNFVLGFLATPLDGRLKLGFSWRQQEELEMDPIPTVITVDLDNDGSAGDADEGIGLGMVMGMKAFFVPEEWSCGIAYDGDEVLVSLDLNYQRWSEYELSEGDKNSFPGLDPDFDDTLNARLGLEVRPMDDLSMTFGYCYQPSPVPDQDNKVTNYLDMDKHIFALGGSYTFGLPMLHKPMTVGMCLQYQAFEDLKVIKDDLTIPSDQLVSWRDQKSYTVEGSALAGGVSMSMAW